MTTARLVGKRVLVTRPRERSAELCFLLEDEGADVLAIPLLEFQPPTDGRPLEAAAARISLYRWVVIASPAAVPALVEAARLQGTLDALGRTSIAVVGPATERAVRAAGLSVARVAENASGEGLFEILRAELQQGDEVLLPVAEEGRLELFEALKDAGVNASRVVAYRSAKVGLPPEDAAALREQPFDAVVFGSPRTVESFFELVGGSDDPFFRPARKVAIGPTTARALELCGAPAAAIAEEPTAEGLLEACVRVLSAAS